MSPFSHLLRRLHLRRQVRQSELANSLGYDQTYISALEIGVRGPPTQNFMEKLSATLGLSTAEQAQLKEAVAASERKFVLDLDAPEELYWLFKELRDEWDRLSPPQIQIIRGALKVAAWHVEQINDEPFRVRRRPREEAAM